MMLDAIVEDPDLVWLGTADEKSTHLTALTRIAPEDLPHVTVGQGEARTTRYFPEHLRSESTSPAAASSFMSFSTQH